MYSINSIRVWTDMRGSTFGGNYHLKFWFRSGSKIIISAKKRLTPISKNAI